MADKQRGRSADDEFSDSASEELEEELADDEVDDDELEEFDDEDFDDADADADDDGRESTRTRDGSVATRARPRTREATRRGPVRRLTQYLSRFVREVVAELQKVIWPTRKELLTYTAVVVVFVALLMTIVSLMDVGFARLMFLVFGRETGDQ